MTVSAYAMGVRSRLARVVDLDSLSSHRCGFEFRQGLWILPCDEAIQVPYGTVIIGGSTQLLARARNNARMDSRSLPPAVKLESDHITFVNCW